MERVRRWLQPIIATAKAIRDVPAVRQPYLLSLLSILLASLAMLPARDSLGVLNVALVFLLICFITAITAGSGPSVMAALISFLVFDVLFIPPYHTFSVARSDHVLALFVYLLIAIVTAKLVARVQARTAVAEREQRRTALLYELNAALIGDITLDQILSTIVERVVHLYGAETARILLPVESGALQVRSRFPATLPTTIDRQHLAIATWAIEHRQPAGQSTAGRRVRLPHGASLPSPSAVTRRERDLLYLPISTVDRVIGVLEVGGKPGGGRFNQDDEALLISFANQAALALERARLADEAARADILAQSDELKSSLLAAVSHDLRTPLATIKASTTSLLDTSVDWSDTERDEFLRGIDEETDRLSRLVSNLLDLSRIEAGALKPDKAWYDIAEVIDDVVARLSGRAHARQQHLTTRIAPDLPLIAFDYVEIAQVLMNLVENALKYTPAGTEVTISAALCRNAIEIVVHDQGPGIPPDVLPYVFDSFYRAKESAHIPSTGIGLAIAKGLVEAHGGIITAESWAANGTTFRFTLPLPASDEARTDQ